jgi:hypothetical protein
MNVIFKTGHRGLLEILACYSGFQKRLNSLLALGAYQKGKGEWKQQFSVV